MLDSEYQAEMLDSQRNQEEYLRQIADHLYHLRQLIVGDGVLNEVLTPRLCNDGNVESNFMEEAQ